MTRFFCDLCGEELIPSAGGKDRLRAAITNPRGVELAVEVMTAKNGVWNSGHFCMACIRRAITAHSQLECDFEPIRLSPHRSVTIENYMDNVLVIERHAAPLDRVPAEPEDDA